MDGSVFYFAGGALVASALVLSFIGVRGKDSFPPSKGAMAGILAVFALIVAGTGAYAIANAEEEQDHRESEQAEEQQQAENEVAGGQQAPAEKAPGKAPPRRRWT